MFDAPFQFASHLERDAALLRRRHYGVIEVADERLVGVHLRPWPKTISIPEVAWLGGRIHGQSRGNRCWLYYNQPLTMPNFLALKYIVSASDATFQTVRRAVVVLDEIARLKRSDAIVCDVTNARISDRLLRRWGWEQHLLDSPRRQFIKRFYGVYPAREALPASSPSLQHPTRNRDRQTAN